VAGEFEGKVDFDPGGLSNWHRSEGNEDIFVVKFSPGGIWLWSSLIGGLNEDERPSLGTDAAGNVYIAGSFERTTRIAAPADVSDTILTSRGKEDIFLVKLRSNGQLVWANTVGGGGSDNAAGLDVDASGNLFVTGGFEQSVDFDPGAGTRILTSAGQDDVFVASYNRDGVSIWAKALHGNQDNVGQDVAAAPNGDVYAVGDFRGTVQIDQETLSAVDQTTTQYDIFVLKLLRPVYPPRAYLPAVQHSVTVQSAVR
jgi:hypothetical protein